MSGQRSTFTPHPIYGIDKGGFTIGDLPQGFNSGIQVLTNVSADSTSIPVAHGGNGVELRPVFSDGVTSCSLDVIDAASSTLLVTFNNVSLFNSSKLFVGPYDQRIFLDGKPIRVRAYNFAGGGLVSIKVHRTS